MKSNSSGKRKAHVKKTVAAVTAMLCMAQPAWAASAANSSAPAAESVTVNSNDSSISVTDNEIPKGAKISSKKAEEIIRNAFPILKNVKVTNAQFSDTDNYGGNVLSWDLQLSISRGYSSYGFSAQVNAVTGEIMNVHVPNGLRDNSDKPVLTREAAKEKALQWIKAHTSDIKVEELKENDGYLGMQSALFTPPVFGFYFQSTVNGIESDLNGINITLDGQGNVTSYSRSYSNEKYPSPTPKLDAAAIRKLYEDQFSVDLAYVPENRDNSNGKSKYFLGYIPNEQSASSLDANTGKAIGYMGTETETLPVGDGRIPATKETFKPLQGTFSGGNDAAEWVKSLIPVPSGMKLETKSLGNRWNNPEVRTWNIRWMEEKGAPYGPGEMVSAEVDAKTGQLYSYMRYRYDVFEAAEVKQPISQQAALNQAFELVSKLVPNASEEWKLTMAEGPSNGSKRGSYQFAFQRYVGDIRVMGDSISLAMDLNGQIQNFNLNASAKLSDLKADAKPTVTPEQAKAKYLGEIELNLKYAYFGGYRTIAGEMEEPTIKLVYYPSHKQQKEYYGGIHLPLDATTGQWRNFASEIGTKDIPAVTDIEGHTSEQALQELVKFRVLEPDKDGKVYPDRQITLGEWYQLVAASVNPSYKEMYQSTVDPYAGLQPDHPYYPAIQVLVGQNWLSYDPEGTLPLDRKLTRDELAGSLTRILNYEKLSKVFSLPTDVLGVSDAQSITNKGAALISMKLGLLPAVDGKFLPQREVTRAEAAEVLVALSKLSGRSDSFMSTYYW